MKNTQEEIDRLLRKPVESEYGDISIITLHSRPSVLVNLAERPGRAFGSLFLFSPEEWSEVVKLVELYLEQEK